jgi:hypothetical protein
LETFDYLCDDSIEIVIDFIVPKSEYCVIKIRKVCRAISVMFFIIFSFPAIDVDDESFFDAAEINHIGTVGMLADEAVSECFVFESRPELAFLWRGTLVACSASVF